MGASLVFAVPGLFALPDLDGVAQAADAGDVSLRETYHDAPDLRLLRSGLLLCHRTGECEPAWTLRLPDGDVVTEPGSAADEPVPPRLRALLTAHLRGAEPGPVAVLRTDRRSRVLHGAEGEPLADLVDDTVSVVDGRRAVDRFREVCLVPRHALDEGGDVATAVAAVAARLVEAGAVEQAVTPRVLRALGPRAGAPPDLPPVPEVDADAPAEALVADAVGRALRSLLDADIDVRRGHEDAVHRMRVACRRLRTFLQAFEPLVFPAAAAHLQAELAWLADALGAARDVQVQRARLARTAAADPLAPLDAESVERLDALLAAQQDDAQEQAVTALSSGRYAALLDALTHWAATPPATEAASAPCGKVVPPLVAAAWRRLARAADRLDPEGPDETWHRARIRAKRARYAAEAAAPVLGKRAKPLARAATAVQEVLGEHQDAALAAERVLALAAAPAQPPAFVLTAGRLVERERAAVRGARAAFPAVWGAASRRKVRAALPS